MYNVSDAVEMGNAGELILTLIKEELVFDDTTPNSAESPEYFDE